MTQSKKTFAALALSLAAMIPALLCGNAPSSARTEEFVPVTEEAAVRGDASVTSLDPKAVWDPQPDVYYAMIGCSVSADADNSTVWLSKEGTIIGAASYYASDQVKLYMPIESNGKPHYPYAAVFSGQAQESDWVESPTYNLVSPQYSVFGKNDVCIPDVYDSETPGEVNVWEHGAKGGTVYGTIFYQGRYFQFEIKPPAIGYRTEKVETKIVYAYDANRNPKYMDFSVRCGPKKISVKASDYVACTGINAVAVAK